MNSNDTDATSQAILAAALDCIIVIDHESRVLLWNPSCELTFGYSSEEALGQDLSLLIIPPGARALHREGMARYLAVGEGPVIGRRIEVEALHSTGATFPVELAISRVALAGPPQFLAYLRDISERRQAETSLRESEQRLKATYEHAFVGIGEVDTSGRFVRANEQFESITGYARGELFSRSIWDITDPDDIEKDRALFNRQMAGELSVYTLEKRYRHKMGHEVWVDLSASVVVDGAGQPAYGVRIVRDVTERRRSAEHQRLLMAELNHRVKNTLATVQSITSQTLRNTADLDAGRNDIEERIGGLARAHDVLTQQSWEGADFHQIVHQALQPYRPTQAQRLQLGGPPVWLAPKSALALAMALQELATNAVKYGALSTDRGTLSVSWSLDRSADVRRLIVLWTESGGPAVKPPTRTGFGSRLLQHNLARELSGEVSLDFLEEGLVCRIAADLPRAEIR